MSTVCKFGYTCRRADCWFSHPEGRAIDGAKGAAPAAVGGGHHAHAHGHSHGHAHAAGPAAGGYVLRPNTQNYQVPHSAPHQVHAGAGNAGDAGAAAGAYRSVTRPLTPHSNDAVASSSAGPTITGNTATLSSGSRACKFGRECHRKDCYFSHPDGRNIDDSPHSSVASTPKQYKKRDAATPSEFEFDDDDDDDDGGELDDKKIEALVQAHDWIPTSGNCLCCKGYARDCTNPDCAAVGMCVTCGGGADTAEVVADESWKDEWFAGSRSCPCCEGYVYRCAGKDPACVAKGECFCKSAPAAAAATTARAAVPAAQTAARTGAASASSAAATAAAAAPAAVQVPGGPAL